MASVQGVRRLSLPHRMAQNRVDNNRYINRLIISFSERKKTILANGFFFLFWGGGAKALNYTFMATFMQFTGT